MNQAQKRVTRSVYWVIALLVIATPVLAAEPIATLPFDDSIGLVVLPLTVNDSLELRCILDTGMPAGGVLFDPKLGEQLGLEYGGKANVGSPGDKVPTMASVAMGTKLALGDAVLTDQRMIVMDARHEIAQLGIDAVVGFSFFQDYVIQINYEARTVAIYELGALDTSKAGEAISLTMRASKPYIAAQVELGKQPSKPAGVPVELLVDTGQTRGLSLNVFSRDQLSLPTKTVEAVVGAGVGGPVRGKMGRIRGIQLGSQAVADVVAAFPAAENIGAAEQDGAIGHELLRRFVVTFDYANGQMHLAKAGSKQEPFEFNMAGLVLRPLESGGIRVGDVVAKSPAAKAGIQPEDRIVSIDGEPVGLAQGNRVRGMFREPGRKLRLMIDRDGREFEMTVKLRRLI